MTAEPQTMLQPTQLFPDDALTAFCEKWEGLSLHAYDDGTGVWTIGYGHIEGVERGQVCTIEQADDWLRQELDRAANNVRTLVRVQLTQGMFNALCSFVYNLGPRNLQRSTLLALLNRGQYSGAAAEFPKWDMAGGHYMKGLYKRRLEEMAMFLK